MDSESNDIYNQNGSDLETDVFIESRMSDLPPSTTPSGSKQTDEPQKQDQVDENEQDKEEQNDDKTADTKDPDTKVDTTEVKKFENVTGDEGVKETKEDKQDTKDDIVQENEKEKKEDTDKGKDDVTTDKDDAKDSKDDRGEAVITTVVVAKGEKDKTTEDDTKDDVKNDKQEEQKDDVKDDKKDEHKDDIEGDKEKEQDDDVNDDKKVEHKDDVKSDEQEHKDDAEDSIKGDVKDDKKDVKDIPPDDSVKPIQEITEKEDKDPDQKDPTTDVKPKEKVETTKDDNEKEKKDQIKDEDTPKEKHVKEMRTPERETAKNEGAKQPIKEQEHHVIPDFRREDTVHQRRHVDDGDNTDEDTRDFRRIGGRKDNGFVPAGPLTTVLVSRDDEERKRRNMEKKSKKQRMRKLAKRKTKKGDGDLNDEGGYTSDEYIPDYGHGHLAEAPYLEQYHYKKRIEHKLDGEHYWSDPEDYRKSVNMGESMASMYGSRYSMDDMLDYDDIEDEMLLDEHGNPVLDANGVPVTVRKHRHKSKHRKGVRPGGTGLGGKGMRIRSAGSGKDGKGGTDSDAEKRRQRDMALLKTGGDYFDIDNKPTSGKKRGKANVIHVKEHTGDYDGQGIDGDGTTDKERRRKRRLRKGQNGNIDYSDYDDSDMDKASDVDSGVDEDEEEVLDVVLTPEQQQMLVKSLFDKDMNLRPEFYRDENGRIVRRLDDSVIYDPSTGRFTLRRRLGRLFNMPRLKRNKKGRPTGGYIDDEYGPKTIEEERKSAASKRSALSRGSAMSYRRTPSDMRKLKADSRNVGFMTPDDDTNSIYMGDEFHKRGGRDMASAFRRKLRNRLFRKKKKRGAPEAPDTLPDVQHKKAWSADKTAAEEDVGDYFYHDGVLNPLAGTRRGKFMHGWTGSPQSPRRRTPGNNEQLQTFREGLEKDRQILESIQGRENTHESTFEPREAFVELDGESSTDPQYNENAAPQTAPSYKRSKTLWGGDGRLVVREKGCPDLQAEQKQQKLFTIVRRPGDLDQYTDHSHHNGVPQSAPMMLESVDQSFDGQRTNRNSDQSPRSGDEATLGSIDNNKLKSLLEELYKDKRYLDEYVNTTEPKSDAVLRSKGLAEHGREYLLERADYWEKRGPLPPRPPMTEVGMRMQRQKTLWETSRTTDQDSVMTRMPEPEPQNLPGVIESPRGSTCDDNDSRYNRSRTRQNSETDDDDTREHTSLHGDENRNRPKNESYV